MRKPWLLRSLATADVATMPLEAEAAHPTRRTLCLMTSDHFSSWMEWTSGLTKFLHCRCIAWCVTCFDQICCFDNSFWFSCAQAPTNIGQYAMYVFEACCSGCSSSFGWSCAPDSVHTMFWAIGPCVLSTVHNAFSSANFFDRFMFSFHASQILIEWGSYFLSTHVQTMCFQGAQSYGGFWRTAADSNNNTMVCCDCLQKDGKKYKCNPWLLRPASILDALPAPLEVVHPTQKNVLWWHQISFLGEWINDLIQFNAAFFVLTRHCIMCDILIQLLLCLHDLDLMFVLVTVKLQPASASTYTMCSFEAYCCGGCRCISGSFATDSVHTIFWLITDHTSCAPHHGVNVYMLIM